MITMAHRSFYATKPPLHILVSTRVELGGKACPNEEFAFMSTWKALACG